MITNYNNIIRVFYETTEYNPYHTYAQNCNKHMHCKLCQGNSPEEALELAKICVAELQARKDVRHETIDCSTGTGRTIRL